MAQAAECLGVSVSASNEEIGKAWKKMALKHHPDKDKSPDATANFQLIHQAYQVCTSITTSSSSSSRKGEGKGSGGITVTI